jgi:hypothetical protein
MKNKTDHEERREEFWCDMLIAAASSESAHELSVCMAWADGALEGFDERFSPEAHTERAEEQKKEAEKQKAKEARKSK